MHDHVLTIYPTGLKVEEVLKTRARAGDVALGHRLTTFPELVDSLDRELSDVPPVLGDAVAAVLARAALLREMHALEARGSAEIGDDGSAADGGGSAALRIIGELKAVGLAAPELTALAARVADAETRRRLGFLGKVARAYDAMLAAIGRADRHDRERRVFRMLQDAYARGVRPRPLVGVTRLVVAEIYDYSLLQFLLVRTLIRIVGDAELVTLAHPENVDASRFVERTWNRFVADPAIADAVLPEFVVRGGRTGALARVLAGIFGGDAARATGIFAEADPATAEDRTRAPGGGAAADAAPPNVTVVAAPSRHAEVVEVGRRIRDRLAGGTRPERIAILCRDLGAYRELIEDVCERYGIRVGFRAGRPLLAHGVVQWIVRLLRAAATDLSREDLAACLQSAYARRPGDAARLLDGLGYRDERSLPLERCIAREEVRLEHLCAGAGPERARVRAAAALARLRQHAPALVAAVARLRALATPRRVGAHVTALADALRAFRLRIRADARARDGAALATLGDLLAELACVCDRLDGERPVPLAAFVARLLTAADGLQVDVPAWEANRVRALAIADARGLDFDTVFVLGLDDGTFPAARAEDGWLDDRMRAEVNRHAAAVLRDALGPDVGDAPLGRVLRGREELRAEDPFLFYLALSMAEREVVLGYPTHDAAGNPLVRSPYVDEVLALVPQALATGAPRRSLVPEPDDCRAPAELVDRAVLSAVAGAPGLLAAVGRALPPGAGAEIVRRIVVERRRARYFLLDAEREAADKEPLADAFVGRLDGSERVRTLVGAMPWTSGRLDELAACGFKFLAARVLGLAPNEDEELELSAREEGALVHRLLEELLRRTDVVPADPEQAAGLVRTLLVEARSGLAAELRAIDPALVEIAWRRAAEVLHEFVRAEAVRARAEGLPARRERRLEWPFRYTLTDHREGAGAARIGTLDLTLTGIVDRVELTYDADGRVTFAEVLDYKLSKRRSEYRARLDPTRGLATTAFQIPVYALALRAAPELRWRDDARIDAGYVLLRADQKHLTVTLDPDVLALDAETRRVRDTAASPPLANRIIALVEGAAAGRFDVAPRVCDPFCDYRLICRYQPPPPEEGE
jgi:hypothetical protein